jgi:hypothetical protein
MDQRISTINIRLRDRSALAAVMPGLQQRAALPGVVLVPWQELLPQVEEMVRLNRVISDIVLAIAFLVIAMAS